MGTNIRPQVSKKNPYYISKHRYYELSHYCRQYEDWKRQYNHLDIKYSNSKMLDDLVDTSKVSDKTAELAILRHNIEIHIKRVEMSAYDTDAKYAPYILDMVTKGYSYSTYSMKRDLPFSRDEYYKMMRKFFWLLSWIREKDPYAGDQNR